MNKIKDFIYDKNDIVIAVLILAVAASVIFWRMDIILAYPKTLFAEDNPVVQNSSGGDEDLPPSDGDNSVSPTDDPSDEQNKDSNTGSDANQDKENNDNSVDQEKPDVSPVVPPEIPLWDGGVLTEDVEVDVQGASSEAAVGCLISEGLFDDYADYKKVCEDAGLDHEKVAAGTFTFKSGTTKAQIAKKINWG